jgi:hypothetical protein
MPQTTDRHAQRRGLPMVVRDRRGSGMRRPLNAVSAAEWMLRAISADVAHVADPRHLARRPPAGDPFELRDPEYTARTLPALRVMADIWFRADVRGLENIPPRGPVLLVGNHSGGTLIADTFIFSQAFYDQFGPERAFFQLAHHIVFKVPGIRAMLTPYGTVPASPENIRRALLRGVALLVYPGGDHETYRASWHSAEIDFAHRTGFVRLALKHGVRIVPVVSIGGQETALFLGHGEHIARLLHLHRLAADRCCAGADRAAVGRHCARPPGTPSAAGEDLDRGAPADRPARGTRRRPRQSRQGLRARHRTDAGRATRARERARTAADRLKPALIAAPAARRRLTVNERFRRQTAQRRIARSPGRRSPAEEHRHFSLGPNRTLLILQSRTAISALGAQTTVSVPARRSEEGS